MVEGQTVYALRLQIARCRGPEREPAELRSIISGQRLRFLRDQGGVGGGDGPASGVPAGGAVNPGQAQLRAGDAGLLQELPRSGAFQRLVSFRKAAGQRPAAQEGMPAPADEEDLRSAFSLTKDDDIRRKGRLGVFIRVVLTEELLLRQSFFIQQGPQKSTSVS